MRTYTPMNSAKLHPVFVGPCVVVKVHSVVVKVHSEHVIAMQLDVRGFRKFVKHNIQLPYLGDRPPKWAQS